MRKLNLVILSFLGLVAVLLAGSWWYLQSRHFGKILSRSVTEASARFDAQVRFRRVSIKFFPPGLALEGVRFRYAKAGTRVESQASEVGVAVDFNLLKGERPRLREIYMREGWVHLELPPPAGTNEHPWDKLQAELFKLPVQLDELVVRDSRIEVEGMSVDVPEARVVLGSTEVSVEGAVKDITHPRLPGRVDLLELDAIVRRDSVDLRKAVLLQRRSRLETKGEVHGWSNTETLAFRGKARLWADLPDVHDLVDTGPVELLSGSLQAKGNVSWSKKAGPSLDLDFRAEGVRSNLLQADVVEGRAGGDGGRLRLESFTLAHGRSTLVLARPLLLWEPSTSTPLPGEIRVRLESFELPNLLSFFGEGGQRVQGRMTGEVSVAIRGKDISIAPQDGFKLERVGLRLRRDDGSFLHVVNAPVLWLHQTTVKFDGATARLRALVKGPRTQLPVQGSIGKGRVDLTAKGALDLRDLGDIAALELTGAGDNTLLVRGPFNAVSMDWRGELRGFGVLGYRIGDTNHHTTIDLGKGGVEIHELKARKGRYDWAGSGVVMWKDFLMDLSIDIPELSYAELKDAIHPLAGGLSFLPQDLEAQLQGNVELYAKGTIKNLAVAADVHAQKINAAGESFRDAKFAFLYKDRVIKLDGLSLRKDQGRVSGNLSYSLAQSRLDYDLKLGGLPARELSAYKRLPFALDVVANGEFRGWHGRGRHHHRGYLALVQGRVRDRQWPDSRVEWDAREDAMEVDANLAGGWVQLNAQSARSAGRHHFDATLDADIPDLPLVMTAFLGDNPHFVGASGGLALEARMGMDDWEWDRMRMQTWLKRLRLETGEFRLDAAFDRPQLVLSGGHVERWDLKLEQSGIALSSRAEGALGRGLKVMNDLRFDASLLELLSKHVQRAEGHVTASSQLLLKPGRPEFSLESSARGLSITTDVLPFTLGDLHWNVRYAHRELEVQRLSFRPDGGSVKATGSVLFVGLDPEINLRWFLDGATIPFKGRSQVTVTGNGMFFGSRRPYVLSGEVVVNKGSVLNELTEFMKGGGPSTDSKYMPPDVGGVTAGLMELDLTVRTEAPVNVSNSMMDVNLLADLHLQGDVGRPVADGRVHVPIPGSRVFFKSNEYQITKGEFIFSSRRPIGRPDFDVAATSVISNYKVMAKAFGNPDSFTFDLSSDPALSKQNVLSLIAFGYTEDLSNAMTPEERQNLTNVGVGSFIFDQFKVTDIVKKQFGLQVNLGTVFMQSNESMLAGRSQDQSGATGAGGLARTRTATNIEVRKRLTEALSLSVSSTVGGSIGQRQRMNLNYGINKNVALEGVYELRTNADGQEDVIDNSVGGDVKFRMTFR